MFNINYRYNTEENENISKSKSIAALTSVTLAGVQAYIGGFNIATCTAITLAGYNVFEALSDILSNNQPKIPSGKIKNGYGEFIVYRNMLEPQVDEKTYNQAYEILNLYTFSQIAENNENESISEICKKRHKIIKVKLQEIDPSLKVAFIPRALYELVFIKQCIEEDVKHDHTACPNVNIHEEKPRYYKKKHSESIPKREKCWHVNSFPDAGNVDDPNVRKVAFWLNKKIFKLFEKNLNWDFSEILQVTEEHINYLKNHGTKQPIRCDHVSDSPGVAVFFNQQCDKDDSMCIQDERSAQVIRNAVAIECSALAQTSFLLYRGSNIQNDHPFKSGDVAHSLSYGTGLFAGCQRDTHATAFYFAVKLKGAHVMPVPVEKSKDGPIFIPKKTNAICQLSAYGECFHARSKAWKNYDLKRLSGTGDDVDARDYLASELSREELTSEFYKLKSAIIKI